MESFFKITREDVLRVKESRKGNFVRRHSKTGRYISIGPLTAKEINDAWKKTLEKKHG